MQEDSKGGKPWKIILVLLVGVFLVGMTSSLIIAGKRVSRVVDKEYYTHGLHYGETLNAAENSVKGWSMTTTISGNQLKIRVQDGSGRPVSGGSLIFETEPDSETGKKDKIVFGESTPGIYQATRPDSNSQVRGMLHFTRGNAAIDGKVVIFN